MLQMMLSDELIVHHHLEIFAFKEESDLMIEYS
jgi:hypothetical protein